MQTLVCSKDSALLQRKAPTSDKQKIRNELTNCIISRVGSRKETKGTIIIKLECVGSSFSTRAKSLTYFTLQSFHSIQPGIIIHVHNDHPESLRTIKLL